MKKKKKTKYPPKSKKQLFKVCACFITLLTFSLTLVFLPKDSTKNASANSVSCTKSKPKTNSKVKPKVKTTYKANTALKYASRHWNVRGYSIKCAEFVSNCVTSGGVKVHSKTVYGLRNKLVNKHYGKQIKLKTVKVGRCRRVKKSSISNKNLSKGDVIVWRCTNPSCKRRNNGYRHAALYSGKSKKGYICAYAHNAPANAKTVMCASCYTCGKSNKMSIYSIHMSK